MTDKIFVVFRLTVVSRHRLINDTMWEVEQNAILTIKDMPNVKIVKQEILNLHQEPNKEQP